MNDFLSRCHKGAIEDLTRMLGLIEVDPNDGLCSTFLLDPLLTLTVYSALQEKNIEKAKQHAFLYAVACLVGLEKFEKESVLMGGGHLSICLLSDNQEVIEKLAHSRDKFYEYNLTKDGSLDTCIQAVLLDDYDLLKRQLETNKKKFGKWFEPDLMFFEGLLKKDKKQMETAVNLLATKHHKRRNREDIFALELISVMAVGYAKLAYIKGFELELDDNPLIFKELLPVKPNKDYWLLDYMNRDEYRVLDGYYKTGSIDSNPLS